MSASQTFQSSQASQSSAAVPALELRGVRKQFGKTEIIRGIDMQVRPGERVAVRAPASGWLIQRLSRRFVRPGDMIFTVGLAPDR